jgi:hypothetical protein
LKEKEESAELGVMILLESNYTPFREFVNMPGHTSQNNPLCRKGVFCYLGINVPPINCSGNIGKLTLIH